jgi:hypothetical protein
VKIPEGDLGKQIEAEFEAGKDLLVTVVAAMGEEMALAAKEAPKGCTYLSLFQPFRYSRPFSRIWAHGALLPCLDIVLFALHYISQIMYSCSVPFNPVNQPVDVVKLRPGLRVHMQYLKWGSVALLG